MHDPFIETLFHSDAWATRCMLQACCELSQAQFEQELGLGHGSIERTADHLVTALFFFACRLQRQPFLRQPFLRPAADEARRRTPAELLARFEAANLAFQAALAGAIERHAMTELINWSDSDEGEIDPRNQAPYAVAIAQMIDHSIHHRAQITDMLRLLGVEMAMEWHPFEWDEEARGLQPG